MASTDITVPFLLNQGRPLLSLEFFPPKTEEAARDLLLCAEEISTRIKPDFVAITDGAGGSTRELTFLYTQLLRNRFGWTVVPHLTCLDRDPEELLAIAESYERMGIRNIMVLRGDRREAQNSPTGTLKHAHELVSIIRKELPDMCVGVAGYPEKHPEAPSLEEDIIHLKEKVNCGASWITTQLFFKPELYESFVSKCRQTGIRTPILPGLLPIITLDQAKRFCQMSQSNIPEHLIALMNQCSQARQWETGVEYLLSIVPALLKAGAPGMHLYILNRSRSLIRLMEKLSEIGKFKAPRDFW